MTIQKQQIVHIIYNVINFIFYNISQNLQIWWPIWLCTIKYAVAEALELMLKFKAIMIPLQKLYFINLINVIYELQYFFRKKKINTEKRLWI